MTRWPIEAPPGRIAPTGANGTRSPTAKFQAPQTTSSGSAPASTSHEADLVGAGYRVDGGHARHEHVVEALAHDLDRVDDEAQVVEGLAQLVDALAEVDELA